MSERHEFTESDKKRLEASGVDLAAATAAERIAMRILNCVNQEGKKGAVASTVLAGLSIALLIGLQTVAEDMKSKGHASSSEAQKLAQKLMDQMAGFIHSLLKDRGRSGLKGTIQ